MPTSQTCKKCSRKQSCNYPCESYKSTLSYHEFKQKLQEDKNKNGEFSGIELLPYQIELLKKYRREVLI